MADIATVREHVDAVTAALQVWGGRDDTKAQPAVRRAANDAVDAIDAALAELHKIRAALVGEIRQSDNAANARIDARRAAE